MLVLLTDMAPVENVGRVHVKVYGTGLHTQMPDQNMNCDRLQPDIDYQNVNNWTLSNNSSRFITTTYLGLSPTVQSDVDVKLSLLCT